MQIDKLHNLPEVERTALCESIILEAKKRSKGDEYTYLCEIVGLVQPFIHTDTPTITVTETVGTSVEDVDEETTHAH